MSESMNGYFSVLKAQLQNSLSPRDDNSRRVPLYCHRLLSTLQAKSAVLPALQRKAIAELDTILDDLNKALASTGGGLVLTPQLVCHIRTRPDYEALEPCLQIAVRLLAEKSDDQALDIQRKIAAITSRVVNGLHQAVIDQDMKPVTEGLPAEALDAAQTKSLQKYLREKFPADAALEIGNLKLILGGGSKRTVVVELRNVKTLPNSVVLRIDMAHGVTGATVVDEFDLIKLVHEAGLPVPTPYLLETGNAVLGQPFIMVSKVEGRNIGDWFEVTEPSRLFSITLAQALAKLHQIPPERVPKLAGSTMSNREIVEHDIGVFEENWRSSGVISIGHEQGFAWLKSHIDLATTRRAITHRDVGCHNMLGHNGDLSAILDWETASIGNPVFDLMYARVAVMQMMPWEEFLDEYKKAGGTRPSAGEMLFFRLLVTIFGMHFSIIARRLVETGFSDGLMLAYAGQRIYLQYQRDLHEAVKEALDSGL